MSRSSGVEVQWSISKSVVGPCSVRMGDMTEQLISCQAINCLPANDWTVKSFIGSGPA